MGSPAHSTSSPVDRLRVTLRGVEWVRAPSLSRGKQAPTPFADWAKLPVPPPSERLVWLVGRMQGGSRAGLRLVYP